MSGTPFYTAIDVGRFRKFCLSRTRNHIFLCFTQYQRISFAKDELPSQIHLVSSPRPVPIVRTRLNSDSCVIEEPNFDKEPLPKEEPIKADVPIETRQLAFFLKKR